jgi:hypothetical protein
MSDYTPSTEEVRNQYSGFSTSNSNHTGQVYINLAKFDRWLAEVKAEAWDRGYEAGLTDFASSMTTNPYRHGETE